MRFGIADLLLRRDARGVIKSRVKASFVLAVAALAKLGGQHGVVGAGEALAGCEVVPASAIALGFIELQSQRIIGRRKMLKSIGTLFIKGEARGEIVSAVSIMD